VVALLIGTLMPDVIHGPTSIFSPAGTPAHLVFGLSQLILGISLTIFVLVAGLLCFALIRYRHKPADANALHEPAQIYGSNQIELSWTVVPVLIIVVLFLAAARVIYTTEHAARPASAIDVTVIGHQFWWEYHYPGYGIVTANELHIPVSSPEHPTPTYLTMTSADTNHSFWIPRLAGKMDVIPNQVNTMWIDPSTAGLYLGQCAQFCGTQHAKMLLRVYADTPQQFQQWIAQQQKPAVQDAQAADGAQVFQRNACINCHTVTGTGATGKFGPDLTHVGSRDTLASGSVPITPTNLRAFVADPSHFKPGALMPPMHLNDRDLDAITGYLTTLR
jgi:cytochrome c oxidase subunit 2